uniref:PWWP domain-containing protein n=1 Tax=Anopheles atroparvus TaxID=41427 RepID=A0AAG5DW73_ANOAO
MVWAKFKNTRYWPAKAIATQKHKTVVFYFGKRIFGVVDSANCLMYSQHNPNRVDRKDLAWMYGFVEADDYICRLIEAHGCFRYAGPNRRFDAASIREHRREVFPDAFAFRFRAIAAVARGPVANARMLAANQERSASQSRNLAGDEDAQSMDTDEEVDVVTVDPPAPPACQLSPPEDPMSKAKHQMALEQLRIDHEQELARAKKMVWCSFCEEPAVMICCWSFFYCSEE